MSWREEAGQFPDLLRKDRDCGVDREAVALDLNRTEQVRHSPVARRTHGGYREERAQRFFELLGGLRRAAGAYGIDPNGGIEPDCDGTVLDEAQKPVQVGGIPGERERDAPLNDSPDLARARGAGCAIEKPGRPGLAGLVLRRSGANGLGRSRDG